MNKTIFRTLLLLLALAPPATMADTVDNAQIITFAPGNTLQAAELNQVISALVTAVNESAARIAELEAALGTSDISGRSYCINALESGFYVSYGDGDENTPPFENGHSVGVTVAGIEFSADGTGTITISEDFFWEGFSERAIDSGEGTGTAAITWTQNGNIVSFTTGLGTQDEETDRFAVSKRGDSMIAAFSYIDVASDASGNWYAGAVAAAVEVDDASVCSLSANQ